MSQEKVYRKPLKNLKELAEELKIPLLSLKGKVTASKNRPLPKLIRKGQTKNWYDEDDFKKAMKEWKKDQEEDEKDKDDDDDEDDEQSESFIENGFSGLNEEVQSSTSYRDSIVKIARM